MEFKFNVSDIFGSPIVAIDHNLVPPGFSGDRRALWDTIGKVSEVVNAMGYASAAAQGLSKPITTAERLRNTDQNIYLLVDKNAKSGKGVVTGMLKTGKKSLYVFDRDGHHFQVQPPCILDFYVHESRQRTGLGKQLFEHMLQNESVDPMKLAIDRPSDKLLSFLNKHYGLNNAIKQMNNYVVYDGFFPEPVDKDSSPTKKQHANGLQQNFTPYGRYGAPRPPCSMGQIIHNQSAVQSSEPSGNERTSKSCPAVSYNYQSQNQVYQQQSAPAISPQHIQYHQMMRADPPQHIMQGQQQQIVPQTQMASTPAMYSLSPQQQQMYPPQYQTVPQVTQSIPQVHQYVPQAAQSVPQTAPAVSHVNLHQAAHYHNLPQATQSAPQTIQSVPQIIQSIPQQTPQQTVYSMQNIPQIPQVHAVYQASMPSMQTQQMMQTPQHLMQIQQGMQTPQQIQMTPRYQQQQYQQPPSQQVLPPQTICESPRAETPRERIQPYIHAPVQSAPHIPQNAQIPAYIQTPVQSAPQIQAPIQSVPQIPAQHQQVMEQTIQRVQPAHEIQQHSYSTPTLQPQAQGNVEYQQYIQPPNTEQPALKTAPYQYYDSTASVMQTQSVHGNPVNKGQTSPMVTAAGDVTPDQLSLNVNDQQRVATPREYQAVYHTPRSRTQTPRNGIEESPVREERSGYMSNRIEAPGQYTCEQQAPDDTVSQSPKLERPRSLSIQRNEESENVDNKIPDDIKSEDSKESKSKFADELDNIENDVEKMAIAEEVAPVSVDQTNGDAEGQPKSPNPLTSQGYFDLKFYHSRLW